MAVLGSFTCASIIIYLNFEQWNNQPTMVSNIGKVDVEDGISMPMLVLCPKK